MNKSDKKAMQAAYKERKVVGGVCVIKNTANGKMLLSAVNDLQASKNRFEFSKSTGGCVDLRLQRDWEKYGSDSFAFETLETLEKKETQTSKEFNDDIKTLKEIWMEKLDSNMLY